MTRTGSLSRNTFEDVVDEGVEDGHRLVGDTGVRMHLLEDWNFMNIPVKSTFKAQRTLVDVRGVSLLATLLTLLLVAVATCTARSLGGLLRGLRRTLGSGLRGGLRGRRCRSLAGSGRGLGGH